MLGDKSNLSEFFRRFKFYAFGFAIGIVAVSILFKGRTGCKMPGTLKLEELSTQSIEYTQHADCRMKCRAIDKDEVRFVLNNGKVNYSKSNVQDKPFPTYAVEGDTKDDQHIRVIVADCDSVSRIVTAIDLSSEKDSCDCR